jgi:hypothetical protein
MTSQLQHAAARARIEDLVRDAGERRLARRAAAAAGPRLGLPTLRRRARADLTKAPALAVLARPAPHH